MILPEQFNMPESTSSVCIISPLPPPYGGMAVQAIKLIENLRKEGIHVVEVRTNTDFPKWLRPISFVPFIRTVISTILFLECLNRKTRHIQVVYFLTGFFNFFFWVTYPAILLLHLKKKRIILSARGGAAGLFFKRYGRLIYPAIKMVDVVTTPSAFLRAEFQKAFHIDSVIVPNIADLDQFECRSKIELQPKLLVTRNLEIIYNVQCVIRAFAIIKEKYPNAILGIAGEGSEKPNLERLILNLGLEDSITFYGRVEHDRIQDLYDSHDILLNTSDVDNLPGAILEAFACGLPVVSTDAGGIPYLVKNGETGFLVERNNHEALADRVVYLLGNPQTAQHMASLAKKELVRYSWSHVRQILLPLIAGRR